MCFQKANTLLMVKHLENLTCIRFPLCYANIMGTLNVVSFVTVLTHYVFSFANRACQRVNDGGGKHMLIHMFFRETARLLTREWTRSCQCFSSITFSKITQLVKYVLRFLRIMK